MVKEKTIENYEDELKSLTRKKMQLIVDADELDKKLAEVGEKFFELSPDYAKVICLTCNGEGIIKNEQTGKREICKNQMLPQLACGGKRYIWMKLFQEVIK